jgi:hypothetical protein
MTSDVIRVTSSRVMNMHIGGSETINLYLCYFVLLFTLTSVLFDYQYIFSNVGFLPFISLLCRNRNKRYKYLSAYTYWVIWTNIDHNKITKVKINPASQELSQNKRKWNGRNWSLDFNCSLSLYLVWPLFLSFIIYFLMISLLYIICYPHTWNMTWHIFWRRWRMTSKVRKRTSRDTKNENKRGKFI